jgi:hypothetical protein
MATCAEGVDQSRNPRHGAPRQRTSRRDELGNRLLERLAFETCESICHVDNDKRRITGLPGGLRARLER